MSTTPEFSALPSSPYARELETSRLDFADPIEREFELAHLRRTRGRARAWHSIVLVMLALWIVPNLLALRAGGGMDPGMEAWDPGNDLLPILLIVSALGRAVLAGVAWSRWYERLYPRIAFPLVAACHGMWAFACSGEILTAHPEYLAPLVTDVFAAYFFSGLLFRRALIVSLVSLTSLLLGAWHHAGELGSMAYYASHFVINMGIAAAAGYAHERSERNLFLDHSLLREMAARDGLTGLKNRRAFDEHMSRVWQQSLRDRKPLGILMIDVDGFKDYNDRYGHQAGDETLKRIARAVERQARRPLDIAARYGGEELVVVLYDLAREHVVEIAERLHSAVRRLGIEHRGSSSGMVTVSVGVGVVHPTLHRSPQGALQLADQALYQAKQQGRNRVVVLEREYHSLTTGVFHQPHDPAADAESASVGAR